jgi:hypothetical protein
MATINLGNIKFNWQGAYAGGTAYAVDDVVSYNGSSYICKLASTGNLPTDTTYWDQMSSAGTNGTDLTTTLTTQGDLVYRDGSGLARLGAGTAGQVLQTGGAGANVSWTDAPSGVVKQIQSMRDGTNSSTTSTTWGATSITLSITPSSTSSKILILADVANYSAVADYQCETAIFRATSSLSLGVDDRMKITRTGGGSAYGNHGYSFIDSPNSTSAQTYTVYFSSERAGDSSQINPNSSESSLTLIEYIN